MGAGMEIRKLSYIHRHNLGMILDVNGAWKNLMSCIPRSLQAPDCQDRRFSAEDIRLVEEAFLASHGQYSSATELLLAEWGTMSSFHEGDRRLPTVQDLLTLCLHIGALRAAAYIQDSVLQPVDQSEKSLSQDVVDLGNCVTRSLSDAPSAAVPMISARDYDQLLEDDIIALNSLLPAENSDFFTSPVQPEFNVQTHRVPYHYLAMVSDNFNEERLLGRGGFSSVFLGITRRKNVSIAIKKLNFAENGADQEVLIHQLNYEVDQLPRLKHPHILELLGYSNDEEGCACLIYPYMPNGTLDERLKTTNSGQLLQCEQRWAVTRGVACGLAYLHSRQKPLVHRDIKSLNILLDEHLQPKIADFGLLRYAVSGSGDTVTCTQTARGTPVYMPPEAISGDVSAKWDVWSFGVVLLELLTSLPVLDRTREDHDLVTFIHNLRDDEDMPFCIDLILDKRICWNRTKADFLLQLSDDCLVKNKRRRPDMPSIVARFNSSKLNEVNPSS